MSTSAKPMEVPPSKRDILERKAVDQLMYLFSHEGMAWLLVDFFSNHDKKALKLLERQYDSRTA